MTDPFENVPVDQEVIGMEKSVAIAKIAAANCEARVIAEDGEAFFVTLDWIPNRLNLEIVQGKVVSVHRG